MKTILSMLIVMSIFVLPGCLDNRPHQNPTGPSITNSPRPSGITTGGLTKEDLEASQNAIQNNMQSLLGANIGKISDKIDTQVASNNELKAMLKVQIDLNTQLQAMIDAKMQAVAAGIAGKIETTTNDLKQNLQAGHDINNTTQQFTKETLEAIKSANRTNAWNTSGALFVVLGVMLALIISAAVVICTVFNNARKDAQGEVRTKQAQLERALAILPPDEIDKVFPKSPPNNGSEPHG